MPILPAEDDRAEQHPRPLVDLTGQGPSLRRPLRFTKPLKASLLLRVGVLLLALGLVAPLLSAQTAAPGLQPGDVVRLKIWREPDLSGDYQVNEWGEVVLPKIGSLPVRALSADSLRHLLVSTYSTYLRDAAIDVTLLRRVKVTGSVHTPGVYQVDQTQTVADVLALAGGATGDGKPDQVQLQRGGKRVDLRLNQDTRLFDAPMQSGDLLYIPQRSWASRNSGVLVGAGITAMAIIAAAVIQY
ncbi:MAG TPA: polysaccharide biosynthesis/export family protein [Gemmatimonadales bacterium]|nr:polysaccharide biosynthesis/export family protein [Gemmatimonadales bacterium]